MYTTILYQIIMKRRKFIATTALGTSIVLLNNDANARQIDQTEEITHYVLFWLKKDLSDKDIKDFAGFFELLKKIPVVKSMKYGKSASTNQRDVVDNSFSYNLVATFKDIAAINSYENHPIHLDAIKKYSQFWEKVVVHDSLLG